MTRERVQVALFFTLLAASLLLCLALMRPFLVSIGWAAILAVCARPLYRRLTQRLHRPSLAAALCCGLVFLSVLLPLALASVEIAREAVVLAQYVPHNSPDNDPPPHNLARANAISQWLQTSWKHLPPDWKAAIQQPMGQIGSFLAKQSLVVLKNLTWAIVEAGVTLFTLFFFLRDAPKLRDRVYLFLPLRQEQTEALLQRISDMIYVSMFGQLVVAGVQGVLDGLAFWIAGLPLPVLWGTGLAVAAMIPFVGAPVVWVPASLFLAMQGDYIKAAGLALWALLVHGTMDHLLRPLFVGTYTQSHLLVTFFGVLGGLMLLGPIGLFVGPVILIVPLVLLEILQNDFISAEASPLKQNKRSEERVNG